MSFSKTDEHFIRFLAETLETGDDQLITDTLLLLSTNKFPLELFKKFSITALIRRFCPRNVQAKELLGAIEMLEEREKWDVFTDFIDAMGEYHLTSGRIEDHCVDFLLSYLVEENIFLTQAAIVELSKLPISLEQFRKFNIEALFDRYENGLTEELLARLRHLEAMELEETRYVDDRITIWDSVEPELLNLEPRFRVSTPPPTTDEPMLIQLEKLGRSAAFQAQIEPPNQELFKNYHMSTRDKILNRREQAKRKLNFLCSSGVIV